VEWIVQDANPQNNSERLSRSPISAFFPEVVLEGFKQNFIDHGMQRMREAEEE